MRHLLLAGLAAAFLHAPALAQTSGKVAGQAMERPPTMAEASTVQPGDHLIGAADAPHEMVVYASVTCGHCGEWFTEEWPRVKSELVDTGRLRVAFRELPTSPAQVSMAGFLIANCGPKDKFFDSVVGQMRAQDRMRTEMSEGRGQAYIESLGAEVGLDTREEVQACFANDAAFAPIDLSMRRFDVTGASGVPAFFVDGERVGGAHKADDIIALATSAP